MSDSLQRIHVSIGTVGVLNLAAVPMETSPTTAYLMLGGRCAMNCAFCAQAHDSQASDLLLSRVTWPEYSLGDVLAGLITAAQRGDIRRVCIQVTVSKESYHQTLDAVRAIKQSVPELPIDVAVLPQDMAQVDELLQAGVDHVGIGLDAASRSVFERVKGGRWKKALSLVEETAIRHPGRVAVHLIVGLGETEREVVEMIQHWYDRGVTVGLFAFTPVRGTPLGGFPPPPLDVYRRLQVARYLIYERQIVIDNFAFSEDGELVDFGVGDLECLLGDGEAFRTSGCPDCNRPFYNERPGGVMYNYPRSLTVSEFHRAVAEMDPKPEC